MNEVLPPWKVFPDLEDIPRQGMQEQWFHDVWCPFWNGLSVSEKASYLERWDANEQWRFNLEFAVPDSLDLKQDLSESHEYLEKHRPPKSGLWSWLCKRR